MSEHRFYAGEDALADLKPGAELVLPADAAHRIARVLRLRSGDRITVFAAGREFACALTETGRQVRARLLSELPRAPAQRRLVLYPALIRPNRYEWLLEKATELGVEAIIPILTSHCAVRTEELGTARLDRWRRIAVEASEQCGRRTVPAIGAPIPFSDALAHARGRLVLAWEGLRDPHPDLPLPGLGEGRGEGPSPGLGEGRGEGAGMDVPAEGPVALFIGPEGGWSKAEVEQACAAGARLMGLGANVLRAETAAIVATGLLLIE